MKTINHNEAIAIHAGPTIAIDTVAAPPSIAETIAQTFGDSTTPPLPGSAGSILPNLFHNPGLANLAAQADDPSSSAPGGGSGQADPLASIAADVTAAMARLTGMDPANPTDPTQKTGFTIGTGLPSADTLKAALAQDGIVVNNAGGITANGDSSNGSGSGQAVGSGSSTGTGGLHRPDGPPPSSPGGSDPGYGKQEDMLSEKVTDETGTKSEREKDYTDANGDRHHQITEKYGDDTKLIFDKDETSGKTMLIQYGDDGVTWTTYDPKTGKTEVDTVDYATGHERNVVTEGGKVVSDSDHPKAGASMPDGDNQSVLPSWLADQIHKDMYNEMKNLHFVDHGSDNVNVRNDGPDTASASDLTGGHGDQAGKLLGGDTSFEGSLDKGGRAAGYVPQVNYNGMAGAIDPGPDSNMGSQANGPTPKDQREPIPTNPTGAHPAGAHQGNGDGQHGGQTLTPINHLVAATTQDLVKAYDASHSGDHKTAQSVEDGTAGHGVASVLGSSSDGHDTSGFAHLILAAQNPKDFGLLAAPHPTAPDTALHLTLNADLSGHGFGPQGVEDMHVATGGTSVAVHDTHVDQHAVTSVLDHVQVAHH